MPLAKEPLDTFQGMVPDMFKIPRYQAHAKIDVLHAVGSQQNSISWYYAVVDNRTEHWVQAESRGMKGTEIWISGQAVADNDRLLLQAGRHPVLIKAVLGKLPPFVTKDRKIEVSFLLRDIADPEQALRQWKDTIRRLNPRLQAIIDRLEPCAERLNLGSVIRAGQEP